MRSFNRLAAMVILVALTGCGGGGGGFSVSTTTVPSGIISTVAGSGTQSYSGEGAVATSAALNLPFGVTVDSSGNFYIADYSNNRVRLVPKATGTYFGTPMTAGNIYTIAGNGASGSSGDGTSATSAELNSPLALAIDSVGNVYIADEGNQKIRVLAKTSGTFFGVSMTPGNIYTVAGTGANTYSGDTGPALNATISGPSGLGFDSSGNLYIGDQGNNRIRVVAKTTGTYFGASMTAGNIYTVAGNVTGGGFSGDGAAATSAALSHPYAVAFDSLGNLYFADSMNNRIRVVANVTGTHFGVTMTAGNIYTITGTGAGGGMGSYSGDGGPATSAALYSPNGLAFDSSGNLYIGDQQNNRVRAIANSTGTYFGVSMVAGNIYTVSGTGTSGFSGDGALATSAKLATPSGLAIDSSGYLYIGDAGNERVRSVTP